MNARKPVELFRGLIRVIAFLGVLAAFRVIALGIFCDPHSAGVSRGKMQTVFVRLPASVERWAAVYRYDVASSLAQTRDRIDELHAELAALSRADHQHVDYSLTSSEVSSAYKEADDMRQEILTAVDRGERLNESWILARELRGFAALSAGDTISAISIIGGANTHNRGSDDIVARELNWSRGDGRLPQVVIDYVTTDAKYDYWRWRERTFKGIRARNQIVHDKAAARRFVAAYEAGAAQMDSTLREGPRYITFALGHLPAYVSRQEYHVRWQAQSDTNSTLPIGRWVGGIVWSVWRLSAVPVILFASLAGIYWLLVLVGGGVMVGFQWIRDGFERPSDKA